jgi:hypothetical protein
MTEDFQVDGKTPADRDALNSLARYGEMMSAEIRSIFDVILSSP